MIKIGDVFSRIDKNGNEWIATVTKVTDYFVDVEKKRPYPIKCYDDEKGVYYKDAISHERAMVRYEEEEIITDEVVDSCFGKHFKTITRETGRVFIELVDNFSSNKYANTYNKVFWLKN